MMAKPSQIDPTYQQFCEWLQQWREGARLTQRALAEKLKRPHSYVYKVENGQRRMDPLELAQWVKACGARQGDVLSAIGLR